MTHVILNEELARTALRDKVVVLTGGSTGIGRAAVELFLGEFQIHLPGDGLRAVRGAGGRGMF